MNIKELTNMYDDELIKSRELAENEVHNPIDGEIYLHIQIEYGAD